MRLVLIFITGVLFGLGITISGMINPAKVINFFDIFGTWDPSLFFVMAGALLKAAIGYQIIFKSQTTPLYDKKFHLPTNKKIDIRLIAGSTTFGIGWGIAGFCPGGAIPALGLGNMETYIFLGAMILGIVMGRVLDIPTATPIQS